MELLIESFRIGFFIGFVIFLFNLNEEPVLGVFFWILSIIITIIAVQIFVWGGAILLILFILFFLI